VDAVACATAEDRRVRIIHPAIVSALDAFAEPVAGRAERLLDALLASRVASTSNDGWRGSRLTGDGFPFELSFCTIDDRLRFTVEPGRADLEAGARLEVAADLLHQLHAPIPADIHHAFRITQREGALNYGAWIGCRLSPDDCVFKLYVEVPEEASALPVVSPLKLPDRTITPRMVGYTPAAQAFEVYVRVPSLEPRHVPAVLAPVGLEGRAGDVIDFLSDTYGHAIRGRIPGASVGISYVIGATATPRVTLYLFARSLWGSDARIRRQFLRTAATAGWNHDAYSRVTAPIATRETCQTFHGVFGITVDRSAMSFAIGVRPVSV
jgi:hypothetical protein